MGVLDKTTKGACSLKKPGCFILQKHVKTCKKEILTSVCSAKQPNAGPNRRQLGGSMAVLSTLSRIHLNNFKQYVCLCSCLWQILFALCILYSMGKLDREFN